MARSYLTSLLSWWQRPVGHESLDVMAKLELRRIWESDMVPNTTRKAHHLDPLLGQPQCCAVVFLVVQARLCLLHLDHLLSAQFLQDLRRCDALLLLAAVAQETPNGKLQSLGSRNATWFRLVVSTLDDGQGLLLTHDAGTVPLLDDTL